MAGDWITGEQVENEFKVVPIEIGKACFDGTITAYAQAGWGPIYEISKLDRVPKYPPPGVDRMDHIQRGETVIWDWEEKVVGELVCKRKKLQNLLDGANLASWIKRCTSDGSSVKVWLSRDPVMARLFPIHIEVAEAHFMNKSIERLEDIQTRLKRCIGKINSLIAVKKNRTIDAGLYLIAEMHYSWNKRIPKDSVLEQDVYKYAWDYLMRTAYDFVIGDRRLSDEDLAERIFLFNFDVFQQKVRDDYRALGQQVTLKDIADTYTQQIRVMYFERSEVEAWRAKKGAQESSSLNVGCPLADIENQKQDNGLPQGGSRLETGDKILDYIQIPNPLTFEDILILDQPRFFIPSKKLVAEI